MRTFVMFVFMLGLSASLSVQAAEQNDAALIIQCEKQAMEQGVEDISGYIAECLDKIKGYVKE